MAKEYTLPIDKYQAVKYSAAIRSKRDVIVLWINIIKDFIANQPASENQQVAKITVVIDSMSRVFCELNNGTKIFSLAFPFVMTFSDGEYCFRSRAGIDVDSRSSSQVVSLAGEELTGIFAASDFGAFIDPIVEISANEPLMWMLIRDLILAEDVYVRYDCDHERANGHFHPIHHIDLGYSNGGSFKVGLDNAISTNALIGILDISTECHYLRGA